jgi:hypothetical protein
MKRRAKNRRTLRESGGVVSKNFKKKVEKNGKKRRERAYFAKKRYVRA